MGTDREALVMDIAPDPTDRRDRPSSSPPAALGDAAAWHRTVLQMDTPWQERLTQVDPVPGEWLTAMDSLVTVIKTLRSLDATAAATTTSSPAQLLPYVTEEAYELLDALSAVAPVVSPDSQPHWLLLDDLIPALLWCVARQDYATMQLIEGIPVHAHAPEQAPQAGILRLAVILDLQTPDAAIALDLALGVAAQAAIPADWFVQPDVDELTSVAWESPDPDLSQQAAIHWLQPQLQRILQHLRLTQPALTVWLDGLVLPAIAPLQTWTSMHLQLRLAFVFTPHVVPISGRIGSIPAIEGEFWDMQERAVSPVTELGNGTVIATPITVVDMPLPPVISTTMIRLADAPVAEQFAQLATQRELTRSLHGLRTTRTTQPADDLAENLLPLVAAACLVADRLTPLTNTRFCLLQPELLLDEFIPKLLWHVTQSSFLGMQWLGGVAGNLLQPGQAWQSGLLRLMVVLELQTDDAQWFIDLATGRFVAAESWVSPPGAIVQFASGAAPPIPPPTLPLTQLHQHLCQSIETGAPEIRWFTSGVAIAWLTLEHDWHSGYLRLHTGLEFIPNFA